MESMSCGKILVVDDHPAARQSVMDALKIFGHEVAGCESARPALQRLRLESFDVILTDLMMPGMDGYAVISSLKDKPSVANIPVIMLTAMAQAKEKIKGLTAGAEDYITKPFSPTDLKALAITVPNSLSLLADIVAT